MDNGLSTALTSVLVSKTARLSRLKTQLPEFFDHFYDVSVG